MATATDPDVFYSFDTAPLDEAPVDDGDDSLHAHDLGAGNAMLLAPLRPTLPLKPEAARRLVVPHPRDLKLKMSGNDVLALQRALSHAGFHPWGFRTGQFGKRLQTNLIRYQHHVGLTGSGIYGPKTHAKLAGGHHYDAYGLWLLLSMESPMEKKQRLFLAGAMAVYNLRARIHYTQGSARMFIVKHRIETVAKLSAYSSLWEDCSSLVTGLCYIAGAPDPNGFRFNGLGYTGTLSVVGHRWAGPGLPPIGALALYGYGFPYKHVTGIVSRATSGLRVVSHGSENGPYLLGIDYRGDRQQVRVYPGMGY